METFIVYILFSHSIDKFYVGYTSDFEERIRFHRD
ncbi:GIY-YIG nuclease family protein [Roseivirga echinicomitans]